MGVPWSTGPQPLVIQPLGLGGSCVGVATATFAANNAPTPISPRAWIAFKVNGDMGYLPWFSDNDPTRPVTQWGPIGQSGAPLGSSIVTFSASNAPPPNGIQTQRWVAMKINGQDGWIPWFASAGLGNGIGPWSRIGELGLPIGVGAVRWTATNAPVAISPILWLTLAINGVMGYLPWFST
jgi:hypothetical protein